MIELKAPLWKLLAWAGGMNLIAIFVIAGELLKRRLRRQSRAWSI